MPAELDTSGTEHDPRLLQHEIADTFNKAVTISLEFHEHQYTGELTEMKIGEFIIFRIKNVDDGLVRIPVDYDKIIFRVLTISGEIRSFNTQLLNKNIPNLLLKFPDDEMQTTARQHKRHHSNLDTPVILESREDLPLEKEVTGVGTVTNMSEGGCSITTGLKLERGDRIKFFLNLTGKNAREMAGVIRRLGKPTRGITMYGIQFSGMNIRVMREVEEFMKQNFPKKGKGG